MLVGIGSRALAIWLPTSPATSFWLEPKKSKVFGQRERENRYRSYGHSRAVTEKDFNASDYLLRYANRCVGVAFLSLPS